MDELFSSSQKSSEPLAARMRPRTLDEYIGQDHIVGKGRLLRRAIAADQLTSVIFYGPPGVGKTTLARVIANHTKANFITLNAVLAGVSEIRKAITEAENLKNLYSKKTILFVDEVHRWNKSQQDALLPWVENGTIILIGATTENPFFEVNKALVSRSRVFQLKPLTEKDLLKAAETTISDKERGYGKWKVEFEKGALEHLIETANGDARSLLNALELAVETTPEKWPPEKGSLIFISKEACEESIQKKVVLYDRDGDYHYDIISAFIKSLRGRDPDAACYWLARMVKAGEDPHFIFRRMLISSCEDTGLSDPHAISVVESCAAAFDRVGLPEGRYFLAHAALYLATSPKSNSSMAFFDALASVEKEDSEVPNHLKDASRDSEGFGHGKGYLYPHAYRDHWVAQQYLPSELTGKVFYTPSTQGYEAKIREEVLSRRELQIASILGDSQTELGSESQDSSFITDDSWWKKSGHFKGIKKTEENLTFSKEDKKKTALIDKSEALWRRRLEISRAETLLNIRDTLIEGANLLRHHRCLVLNADDALLVFELLRKTPEGFTLGICRTQKGLDALKQYSSSLEDIDKPVFILKKESLSKSIASFGEVEFDRVFARDIFSSKKDIEDLCKEIQEGFRDEKKDSEKNEEKESKSFLHKDSLILISQRIPSSSQHLGELIKETLFSREAMTEKTKTLLEKIEETEKAFFSNKGNPLFSWDEDTIKNTFEEGSFLVTQKKVTLNERRKINENEISKWFDTEKSLYGSFILEKLGEKDTNEFKKLFVEASKNHTFNWKIDSSFFMISLRKDQ